MKIQQRLKKKQCGGYQSANQAKRQVQTCRLINSQNKNYPQARPDCSLCKLQPCLGVADPVVSLTSLMHANAVESCCISQDCHGSRQSGQIGTGKPQQCPHKSAAYRA